MIDPQNARLTIGRQCQLVGISRSAYYGPAKGENALVRENFDSVTQTGDFYSPDCDPAPVPIPPGGAIEDEALTDGVSAIASKTSVVMSLGCGLV